MQSGYANRFNAMKQLLILLGLLVSLVVTWAFIEVVFLGARVPAHWFGAAPTTLAELSIGGNYDAIVADSQQAAQEAETAAEHRIAKQAEAYGRFMQGSVTDRVEAVRIARDQYVSAQTDAQRAKAINQILEMVTTSKSTDVFNEVFGNEPFSKYYSEKVYSRAVAGLAQESYAYQPSVIARAFTLIPHSDPLVSAKAGSLNKEKAAEHVQAIRMGLADMEQAYAAELLGPLSDVQRVTLPLTYWYWHSYFASAAARVDTSFSPRAEQAYRELFAYYDATRDSSGNPLPILEVRMPDYHMFYVRFLLDVQGNSSRDEAAQHVRAVIDMVSADPALHEPGYIAKLRGLASGNATGQVTGMRLLRQAADVYPPFKDFVRGYGVEL